MQLFSRAAPPVAASARSADASDSPAMLAPPTCSRSRRDTPSQFRANARPTVIMLALLSGDGGHGGGGEVAAPPGDGNQEMSPQAGTRAQRNAGEVWAGSQD